MVDENGNPLDDKGLVRAIWFVEHREFLKRIALGCLIAFDVLTVGYGLFGYIDYYLLSWNKDLTLRAQMPTLYFSSESVQYVAPKQLDVSAVNVFSSTSITRGASAATPPANRFDFVSFVTNPNSDWYATFQYQFISGDTDTPITDGFILPTDAKYIGAFGQAMSGFPRQADFRITNLKWHRVDRHVIRDYAAWSHDRLNFMMSNVVHTSTLALQNTVGRTSFDVANRTSFSYWRIGFFVGLFRGAALAAANEVSLDALNAGETRHVDVNWFETLPSTSDTKIIPEVNFFDPSVYMPPKATP